MQFNPSKNSINNTFDKPPKNFYYSGREYENLIMDCCQLEDGVTGVKREDATGNDPENGSPDADRGGIIVFVFFPIELF